MYLVREHKLHGIVTGLEGIKTISSLEDKLDRLLISFKDAKVFILSNNRSAVVNGLQIALLEWSDAVHDLVPVSIHTYERAPQLVSIPTSHRIFDSCITDLPFSAAIPERTTCRPSLSLCSPWSPQPLHRHSSFLPVPGRTRHHGCRLADERCSLLPQLYPESVCSSEPGHSACYRLCFPPWLQ